MEGAPESASAELALAGEWAPLKAIDGEFGETTMVRCFPMIEDPDRLITVTHDPDMKFDGCNVYTFTRPKPEGSFFVVIVDSENDVARAVAINVDPENGHDTESFWESVLFQAQLGLTVPTIDELGELGQIVEAFVESQVGQLKADIENR